MTPNILAAALVVSPAASAKAIFRSRAVNRRSHSAKSIRQAATSAGVARLIFDKNLVPAAFPLH